MSQNPFDAFSKEFLSELLTPFGEVERSFEVPGESKYIDLLFRPTDNIKPKETGILKQVISTPSIIEAYSSFPSVDELSTCLLKLLWLREDITRKAKSEKRKLATSELPWLWVLVPTLSAVLKKASGVVYKPQSAPGIYHFPNPMIQAVIISIRDLPTTPEYLWLRILGRNRTQASAIEEVLSLSRDDPRRASVLRMLFAWKIVTIETNPSLIEFSEVKTMAYPQVYLDWEAATEARGQAIGETLGEERKALSIVLRQLNRRIGLLDEATEARVRELSITQLDDLSEALLDFAIPTDLDRWLDNQPNT
jgi:Domain of unknown function (DUF4351)